MNSESFKKTIESAQSIVIFAHVNPDGDTLGTMSALNLVLKNNFDKDSVMVAGGKIPEIYKFLPNTDKMKYANEIEKDRVFDLAIAVDIAAKDRMAEALPIFERAKTKMNLDHHKTNNNYGDVNFVRADAACAGEVLFDLVEELGLKIDEKTAEALYTSILTDTGSFKYENTKAITLKKAAKLIDYGANPSKITRFCYESKPKPMALLQADSITNANFIENDKIAYVCLTDKDLARFNAEKDHTEGIVEELRRIVTTEVACVMKEVDENTVKVSLRSKNTDVSLIASAFGGGGHTFAAGCVIRKPLKIACDKMIDEIKKYL